MSALSRHFLLYIPSMTSDDALVRKSTSTQCDYDMRMQTLSQFDLAGRNGASVLPRAVSMTSGDVLSRVAVFSPAPLLQSDGCVRV
jgi:hypothetical protein